MPNTRIVATQGARLHTRAHGKEGARPLLLLHGGSRTSSDFEPLLPLLSDYYCVLVDSRGHGASTLGTQPLSYPLLAADAEAVIAAYGLKAPVIIGHSDGGIAGVYVAARQKVTLGGLITLGAQANPPPADLLEQVFRPLTAAKWRTKFPDEVRDYEQRNPEPDFDRYFAAIHAMWINTTPGNYPGDITQHIHCPTLVLAGDSDHLVPRALTVQLADGIPNSKLGLFPFGDHMIHQEQPEQVAPWVIEFLNRLS